MDAPRRISLVVDDGLLRIAWLPIVLLLAATALQLAFQSALVRHAPFVIFYPAVIFAALYGGWRAGLLATALSASIAGYFWIAPSGHFATRQPEAWLGLVIFLFSGALVTWFTEALQRARARASTAETQSPLATERLRAQEQLRTTLESIRDGFFACDADWRFVYVNTQAEQILGIRSAEVLGKNHWDVFPLTRDTTLEREYRRAAAGEIRDFESFYEPWQRWFHNRCFPREGGGISVYFEDITARKQVEEDLRGSEGRLLLAVRSARLGIFDRNLVTGAAFATEQHFQLHGLRMTAKTTTKLSEPYNYRQWAACVHPDDLPAVEAELRRCQAEHAPYEAEYRVVWPDGSVHWIAARGMLQYDAQNQPQRLLGIVMDMTERKKAQETVRESERRERERAEELATLFEAVPIAVFIARDPDCLHLTGNRLADEILRIPHGNELSLSSSPNARPTHFKPFKDGRELRLDELPAQRAARGENVQGFEFSLVFDDEMVRHVLGYGTPLLDDQGRPRGTVAALVDITERKWAEAALRASLHEKDVLLKEVHHRVKNNMQILASLVSLQADAVDDPAIRDIFGDFRDQVRTMALVHENLYKSENLANINFAAYANGLTENLSRMHGRGNTDIRLTLDLEPATLPIESAVPCGLILNELVTNAYKHAFRARSSG